jgi:hypothetical protein
VKGCAESTRELMAVSERRIRGCAEIRRDEDVLERDPGFLLLSDLFVVLEGKPRTGTNSSRTGTHRNVLRPSRAGESDNFPGVGINA